MCKVFGQSQIWNLGYDTFQVIIPPEVLGMTSQANSGGCNGSTALNVVREYETPKLTLVGNLRGLLASGGTRNEDGATCTAGGVTFDPGCVGAF
jgi:hypothetical protein